MTKANTAQLYAARRQRLLEQIDGGIVWITNSGAGFNHEPDKNLEYLTGLRSASACLILAPQGMWVDAIAHCGHYWFTDCGSEYGRGRRATEALFVPQPSSPWGNTVVQKRLPSLDQMRALSGVEAVFPLSEADEVLRQALNDQDVLWVSTSLLPDIGKPVSPAIRRINAIKERFYWVQVRNIAPKIDALRLIKDSYEIECIRMAYQLTKDVIEVLMRTIKPGDNEAKMVGLWQYEVKKRLDTGKFADLETAFGPIVSSGRRSSANDYWAGNQTIEDGDMILIDCGVSYNGYAADISRAWPANGRFTPRQRELYTILYDAQHLGLEAFKPGGTCVEARSRVWKHFKKHNVQMYGLGRNCHPVGLNVEDADYFCFGTYGPFQPNTVWAFEPMLMLQDEGVGIRLEDGVLVTETGHEMMPAPAKGIDAVEALCRGA